MDKYEDNLDFLEAKRQKIATVKGFGEYLIDNAHKIEALFIGTLETERVNKEVAVIDWAGSFSSCLGLSQMMVDKISATSQECMYQEDTEDEED